MKKAVFAIMSVVVLASCPNGDPSKTPAMSTSPQTLPSGVEIRGKLTPEDSAFFDTAFSNFAKAYETKDLAKVMTYFSAEYKDFSTATRVDLEENIKKMFADYKDITWQIRGVQVQVMDDKAASTYDSQVNASPLAAGAKKIAVASKERLIWKKEGSTWKIVDQLTVASKKK